MNKRVLLLSFTFTLLYIETISTEQLIHNAKGKTYSQSRFTKF